MSEKRANIRELCRQLGDDYCIRVIDLEKCIYRNFGNGFDIEVSGVNSKQRNRRLTIFLWFVEPKGYIMVEREKNVECTPEAISAAVKRLADLSDRLIKLGYTDVPSLKKWKENH